MHHGKQHVLISGQPHQPDPQQRAVRQRERPEGLDVDELAQGGLPLVRVELRKVHQLKWQ